MTKVMFITSFIRTKGPNNQLMYLLSDFNHDDVLPIVCVLGSREVNENTVAIESKCKVIYLNYSWGSSLLIAPHKLNLLIKKHNIDVVQSFGIRCDIITLLLSKVKKIVVVRNLTMINWSVKGLLGKIIGYLHLKIIERFDSVIACSAGVQEHLLEYGIESFVINNSILLKVDNYEANKTHTKLNNFVTVSTMHPGKNIEFIIKTFISDPNLKECSLNIIGFVHSELQQKYKKHVNIIFHGYVDNPLQVYASNDCFISASLHEGLPNAVLEALSVCCPVILSDITSHKVIVEGYNDIGRIFSNNSQSSLAAAIKEQKRMLDLVNNVRFFELLDKRFSPKYMTKNYVTQYKVITDV
ncbi:glycosyltransferase family 4 protein [Colwellia sp. MB02u-9]|uniref:glycosyltransferase family 4 protein n=1 Tax=Colwellia sp. MB02u-9 TaxID=2759823 RepID=UPI0015F7026E|nr:glycosyltransferase family 4 protein [Colwellia sp. MB02u-9]MBA6296941.1 glycosyltransferase family 4 protein [Colwellia sp. MB02u-9]